MSALITTATVASPKTKSLRATIPEGVVAYLGIEDGNKIEWWMDIEDGEKVVKLKKAESAAAKVASKYARKGKP